MGKTRLARKLGREVLREYGGGVWFIDLAPVADETLLPGILATALAARGLPGQPLLGTVATAIGHQRLLLILDNCEHLVHACAALAEALLGSCPRLTIMATSREVLHIPGETIWTVPPLTLPNPSPTATVATFGASETIQLFVERARAAVPTFALTTDTAAPSHAPGRSAPRAGARRGTPERALHGLLHQCAD